MWHLVKSELIRFRGPTVTLAVVHLLILAAVAISGEFFVASEAVSGLAFMAYSTTALAFGLYQYGTHRKRHHWTFLLQRPLPAGRIFAALAGAGAVVTAIVLFCPMLLVTLAVDLVSTQAVEFRHYLAAPFVWGLGMSFYLAGCFMMLSAGRASASVLVLPFFFVLSGTIGPWVFLVQVLVVAWLAVLSYAAFQPNLSSHLRRPLTVALAALPLQYVFFGVCVFVALLAYSTLVAFQEHGWKSYAVHAWDDYFAEGTIDHVDYLDGTEAVVHGLRLADTPRSRRLQAEVARRGVSVIAVRRDEPELGSRFLFLDASPTDYPGPVMVDHPTFSILLLEWALEIYVPEKGVRPWATVVVPYTVRNLSRAFIGRIDEGFVVSFVFGTRSQRGFGPARQTVGVVTAEGDYEEVVDEPLGQGTPDWSRHRGFIVSPLLQTLHDLAWTAVAPDRDERVDWRDVVEHPVPPAVALWALVLAVASAAATSWVTHRRPLERSERWAWTAVGFLSGFPGFLSFLFLTPSTRD